MMQQVWQNKDPALLKDRKHPANFAEIIQFYNDSELVNLTSFFFFWF
jgi:hypothetical protein